MLTKTRQKLARFRQRASPFASLVDFSLWSLRSVLNPRHRIFWLVALISVGFVAAAFLTPYELYIGAGFIFFLLLVLLALLLSYVRSISRTHTHAIGLARQEIGASLTDIRKEQINSASLLESQMENRLSEADQNLKARADSLETEIDILGNRLVDLTGELRALRSHSSESVQQLAEMQDSLEKTLSSLSTEISLKFENFKGKEESSTSDLSEIMSDIAALKTRLDNTVKTELKTSGNLSDAINALKTQLAEIKKAK